MLTCGQTEIRNIMTMINKTIAVCNQKGGVAKTTSTAAISSELARRGYKVLMIDLDSQGSLSKIFLKNDPEETIADTLNDGIYPIVSVTDRLDIIPCNTDISSVAQAMNEPDDRKILAKALKKIKGEYDFIVLDCSPSFNFITINALSAADFILVPCQTSKTSMDAIAQVSDACCSAAPPTHIHGAFFTMYDPRPCINRRIETMLRSKYCDLFFETQIRKSVKVEEAVMEHKDIINYDAASNPAKDYQALVEEIITRFVK